MSKLRKLNKAIKIFLNYFLGPVLFIWIIYSIYHQIAGQPNLIPALQHMLGAFSAPGAWKLWVALLLMPINWALETCKWHLLVNREYPFSFQQAAKSVLSGISLSLNTPNRIGEYGGRILYLAPEYRLKGVLLTMISSVSQLLITLYVGLLAVFILQEELLAAYASLQGGASWFWFAFVLAAVITIALSALYFRIQWLVQWLRKIPFVKEKFAHTPAVGDLPIHISMVLLGYSLLRFVVFAMQYVFIWQALGVGIAWQDALAGIAVVFFIMSVVPTIALVELGLRGKVAIGVMGFFTANAAAILTGTISVWVLNLIVPALLGALLMLTIKGFKT